MKFLCGKDKNTLIKFENLSKFEGENCHNFPPLFLIPQIPTPQNEIYFYLLYGIADVVPI